MKNTLKETDYNISWRGVPAILISKMTRLIQREGDVEMAMIRLEGALTDVIVRLEDMRSYCRNHETHYDFELGCPACSSPH